MISLVTLLAVGCLWLPGCSRKYYREQADREAYALLQQRSAGTPWEVPREFTIEADPRSRLFDPGDPDYPTLPDPGPRLHDYALPDLSKGEQEPADGAESLTSFDQGITDPERTEGETTPPTAGGDTPAEEPTDPARESIAGLPIQPIPESYWEAMPPQCLARMLDFDSVREEYFEQYKREPPAEILDSSKRLSLNEIVELALLNSREYQAQKEQLHRAALALTLERFDYATKFAPGGNGVDTEYTYAKDGGTTAEGLSIGSAFGFDKMLAFGGMLLARFTNNIVFTFEGPEGFSRDVSSEMVFAFTQSIFQRDILLNPLVQSERELVYAARDYTRFRKEFFVQLASQYYGLLRNYRNIEIESQNYFSLVRTFEQAQAELRSGVQNAPNRVAVDQFEQSMLSGRSSLISACNRLERDLDSLKLALGLPTELLVNIELAELEELTLRDEIEVAAERVRRWRNRVLDRRNHPRPDRSEILNANIFLIERLLDWWKLERQVGRDLREPVSLEELLRRLRVDEARLQVERDFLELRKAEDPTARSPLILIYQRASDVVEDLLRLGVRQVDLAAALGRDRKEIAAAKRRLGEFQERLATLRGQLAEILADPQEERLRNLLDGARRLIRDLERLVETLDRLIGAPLEETPEEEKLRTAISQSDELVGLTNGALRSAQLGLPKLEISAEEALATALVQRLDLMNERWRLADDRRAVKLAADDLKSVLDLNASHALQTEPDKPFKFDAHQTQVGLSVDLPLNRQAQRNVYRQALIGYQAGRRNLMALEDEVKFDIRDGLRSLEETRIQYPISVTRAALAAEQVTSVRLQLALGVQGVRGTDLLDALQSSREALIAVANARIGYIVDRARFTLDLELLRVDTGGGWPEINDMTYQPEPDVVYPEGAGPTYGDIPPGLGVSDELRRMLDSPLPGPSRPTRETVDPSTSSREPPPSGETQQK